MKLAMVCAGFTEIHAASVALIAYASSYVKCHFRNRARCSHGTCISTRLKCAHAISTGAAAPYRWQLEQILAACVVLSLPDRRMSLKTERKGFLHGRCRYWLDRGNHHRWYRRMACREVHEERYGRHHEHIAGHCRCHRREFHLVSLRSRTGGLARLPDRRLHRRMHFDRLGSDGQANRVTLQRHTGGVLQE